MPDDKIQLDEPIRFGALRRVASRIDQISPAQVAEMQSWLTGDRSEDFYLGLFAGFIFAQAFVEEEQLALVGVAAIVLADFCEQKEFTE